MVCCLGILCTCMLCVGKQVGFRRGFSCEEMTGKQYFCDRWTSQNSLISVHFLRLLQFVQRIFVPRPKLEQYKVQGMGGVLNLISELITCRSLRFIHTQPWELLPILQNIKVSSTEYGPPGTKAPRSLAARHFVWIVNYYLVITVALLPPVTKCQIFQLTAWGLMTHILWECRRRIMTPPRKLAHAWRVW
jgi:hypothetical protein